MICVEADGIVVFRKVRHLYTRVKMFLQRFWNWINTFIWIYFIINLNYIWSRFSLSFLFNILHKFTIWIPYLLFFTIRKGNASNPIQFIIFIFSIKLITIGLDEYSHTMSLTILEFPRIYIAILILDFSFTIFLIILPFTDILKALMRTIYIG